MSSNSPVLVLQPYSPEGQLKSSVAHFESTDIIGTKQKLLQSISLLGRPYDEARLVIAAILDLEGVIKSREREMQEKLAELQQNITHAQRLSDFALSEVVIIQHYPKNIQSNKIYLFSNKICHTKPENC